MLPHVGLSAFCTLKIWWELLVGYCFLLWIPELRSLCTCRFNCWRLFFALLYIRCQFPGVPQMFVVGARFCSRSLWGHNVAFSIFVWHFHLFLGVQRIIKCEMTWLANMIDLLCGSSTKIDNLYKFSRGKLCIMGAVNLITALGYGTGLRKSLCCICDFGKYVNHCFLANFIG